MVKQTIKVFGRVKPTKKNICVYEIQNEESDKDKIIFGVPRDHNLYINNSKEEFQFKFDHIFDRDTKQENVFHEVAQDVIDNCLSGYNGTIFAYGQTGSGKTFTITGGAERYADRGIIPRTLEYLFAQFEKQPNLAFQTHISYLEIYNESGYDLLDPNKEIKKMEDLPKVLLMEDSDGGVHLRNLSLHQANSEEDALNLLFIGDTNRMIAETPMNQASTRSHCIFTIHISSREPGSATIRKAKLHLVDLAGSERVHKTGVNGTLLTEAKYINLSLHFLEQVIVSLSEKNRTHIPYRNSMMTSVLRDSLGGNCMTTMVATLSVESKNLDESISTCRFAQRVALIKNDVSVNEELDPRLMVAKLKREVAELKTQLAMGSEDGVLLAEPLTPEELESWKVKCKKFLEDKDPDSILETGPDLRKILACFKFLKGYYTEAVRAPNSNAIESSSPLVTHVPVPQSAYDSKEVKDLKELLKQRDNEINILVGMLKKEKSKNMQHSHVAQQQMPTSCEKQRAEPTRVMESDELRSGAIGSRDVSNVSASSGRSSPVPVYAQKKSTVNGASDNKQFSHRTTVNNIVQRKIGDMSLGRQEAFEIFKRDYRDRDAIESKKRQLKECYAIAKDKGQKVNEFRLKINETKAAIQQCRIASVVNSGASEDGDSVRISPEEKKLRQNMEHEKEQYKGLFEELKQVKTEIEHLQHLLEQDKLLIVKEFEAWWAKQELAIEQNEQRLNMGIGESVDTSSSLGMSTDVSISSSSFTSAERSRRGFDSNADSKTFHSHLRFEPSAEDVLSRNVSSASSSNAAAVGSGETQKTRGSAASIPLTGDAKTDADIMAFFKARHKAMAQMPK